MQAWFSGSGATSSSTAASSSSPPSLLADWNSYAAARSAEEDAGGFGVDIEAAVRSANDRVAGTLGVVSKGVLGLPGSFKSTTSSVPSGRSFMYFGLFLTSGVFLVFIAFTIFLPVMVVMPQKFAICFTMGCALIIGSFFALKGPKNQLYHMISKERLPFTVGFVSSMIATIYVSMVLHSYILSVFFSCIQLITGTTSNGIDNHSLCPCSSILRYFLLPWWICWNEISFISRCVISAEVLRAMSSPISCCHTSIPANIHRAFCYIFLVFAFDVEIVSTKMTMEMAPVQIYL